MGGVRLKNRYMGTHTRPTSHYGGRLTLVLCGHTLDQHHIGWRLVEDSSIGGHTGPTSHWVEAGSSIGPHSGPTSHWVEAG